MGVSPGSLQCTAWEPAHDSPGTFPPDPPGSPSVFTTDLLCSVAFSRTVPLCEQKLTPLFPTKLILDFCIVCTYFYILFVCLLCACVVMCTHGVCVKVKGQHAGIGSLLSCRNIGLCVYVCAHTHMCVLLCGHVYVHAWHSHFGQRTLCRS